MILTCNDLKDIISVLFFSFLITPLPLKRFAIVDPSLFKLLAMGSGSLSVLNVNLRGSKEILSDEILNSKTTQPFV